jgi:hypothetical protein
VKTWNAKLKRVKVETEQLRITAYKLRAQLNGIKEATDESITMNTREHKFEQSDDLLATQDPPLWPMDVRISNYSIIHRRIQSLMSSGDLR